MQPVNLVVEGPTDRAAAEKILLSRSLPTDPNRVFGLRGKSHLDKQLVGYNRAAKRGPWLVLRDTDNDAGGCPLRLRLDLLPEPQHPALCLRFAVRSLDAWILADVEAVAEQFSVSQGKVPA
jgi:hypothetical protein